MCYAPLHPLHHTLLAINCSTGTIGLASLPRTTDSRSIAFRQLAHPAGLADLVSILNLRLPAETEHGRRSLFSRDGVPG